MSQRRHEGIETRKRKDGSVAYRVPWREGGTRDGERGSRTFDTLDEAKTFRAALVLNDYRDPYEDPAWLAAHGYGPAAAAVKTFREVATEYLATLVDADRRTIAEYEHALANHIYEADVVLSDGRRSGPLGRRPVDRFTADVIQQWIAHMRSKTHGKNAVRHYSPKTIVNIHGSVIAPVFDYAISKGYTEGHPCRGVRLPERKGKTVRMEHVLDEIETPQWIDCAYVVDGDTGDVTATILGCGVRWGELTALRVRDVNELQRVLSIAQVVKEDENRRPYICTTEGKSANAFRTISLPPMVLEILTRRMAGRGPDDLLFPAPGQRGATLWRNAHFTSTRWKKVKALAASRGLTKDPHPAFATPTRRT